MSKLIKLYGNQSISSALYTLKSCDVEEAVCNFNGVLLSSNDTIDTAYFKVTGYTKDEYDYFVSRGAVSNKLDIFQMDIPIVARPDEKYLKVKEYIEEGKKYIYPQKHKKWAAFVRKHINSAYDGKEIEYVIELLKAIEGDKPIKQHCTYAQSLRQTFNDIPDDRILRQVVTSFAIEFSKHGIELIYNGAGYLNGENYRTFARDIAISNAKTLRRNLLKDENNHINLNSAQISIICDFIEQVRNPKRGVVGVSLYAFRKRNSKDENGNFDYEIRVTGCYCSTDENDMHHHEEHSFDDVVREFSRIYSKGHKLSFERVSPGDYSTLLFESENVEAVRTLLGSVIVYEDKRLLTNVIKEHKNSCLEIFGNTLFIDNPGDIELEFDKRDYRRNNYQRTRNIIVHTKKEKDSN